MPLWFPTMPNVVSLLRSRAKDWFSLASDLATHAQYAEETPISKGCMGYSSEILNETPKGD